jgi:hypothetical protein
MQKREHALPLQMIDLPYPCLGKGNRQILFAQLGQLLHQAALAASGIVLVDDTLPSRYIKFDNGSLDSFYGSFLFATVDFHTSLLHKGASAAAIDTVAQSPFFILLVALNRRLNVCQSTYPPKFYC